ncbi:MAG: TolC family protein [Peptococcaceae bacterium]|nr:TolC family protein [Peptococcaceae bacterium]
MNKKTLKTVAAATVLTFGLSVVPAPAYAVSTNIVAETKDVNTLTISQIQDLAVIYNDTKQSLLLKQKQLDLQAQMLRNNRRNIETQINSMDTDNMLGQMIPGTPSVKELQQQLAAEEAKGDAADQAKIIQLKAQIEALKGANDIVGSLTASSMQANLDSALDSIEQINDALDSIDEGKEDLNDAMGDLEKQMRYAAANLSLNAVQLDKAIELMEDNAALLERSVQIAELQQKLGMNISTDVSSAQASLAELKKTIADQEDTLDTLKRSINILIGRSANSPLEIVPMNLPIAIESAPEYTPQLVSKFLEVDSSLETLNRDRTDLKDSVKDDMGSDEKQDIDYQVMAKDMEIDNQRQAVQDDLKAMLAKINSNAAAYKVSRQKYVTEQKNFEFAQKKYELGMISELTLRQAEAALKQAELTNMQNGYQYYIDWQKYYLAEKGIEV